MNFLKKCLVCLVICGALSGCSTNSTSESSDNHRVISVDNSVADSSAASADNSSTDSSAASADNSNADSSAASSDNSSADSSAASADNSSEESSEPQEVFKAAIVKAEISAKNSTLNASRAFTVDEQNQKITINVGYDNYVDIRTLRNCFVDIEVSGGEYQFNGAVNDNGSIDLTQPNTLAVTDTSGEVRNYAVEVNRTVCDLPIVNIYLANGVDVDNIDLDVYSDMTMYIDSSGADGFESTGFLDGGIHGRGHSTWKWEKKPYRIKLNEKAELLGLPSNKDWILLANYCDESLIRNIVAYDMGRELGSFVWTPTQYNVDLFVNGEYRGVYAFGEQREIAKKKINLYESPTEVDRGYLLEVGGADDDDLVRGIDYFTTKTGSAYNITFVDPKSKNMTEEQRKFIMDYVNAADSAIVSGEGYENYIDVDSYIDWIIIHELTCNLDSCFRRSCYFTKDKGGKLKMGPIWDFDLAFGNFSYDNASYNTWNTIGSDIEDAYIETNWCNYLMNDPEFRSRFKARWFEVRDKLLAAAENSIEKNSALTQRSQAENYKVWQTMGTQTGYQSWATANLYTYEQQIDYLRNFLEKRAAWIDANV